MSDRISEADYVTTQNVLVMLASIVKDLNLDGFIEAIHTAEAIGPIV